MTLASAASSIDGGFYTWVTELAQRSPAALDSAVRVWSDYGLALFALLMLASWWRSRPADPARTAMALCAPLTVLTAYLVNDLVKSVFHEQRPCRSLHVVTVEACPALGDWSFPSNHAAIAAAAATAIWLTDHAARCGRACRRNADGRLPGLDRGALPARCADRAADRRPRRLASDADGPPLRPDGGAAA